MLKPWLREICKMPDGGGGPEGGGGGTDNANEGSGPGAPNGMDPDTGDMTGAGPGAPSGPGNSASTGSEANLNGDLDMAFGWDLSNPGQTGQGLGFTSADRGNDLGRGISHALDRAWNGISDNLGATLAGVAGTALAGPFAGAIASAIASSVIDGKNPGEAIGQGIGGLAGVGVGGLAGMGLSMAGSRGGAALGSQLDSSFTGSNTSTAGLSIDPTSSALDIAGPQGDSPTGGGVNFTYSPPVTGQTFNSYIPTPAQTPVQPAWRGLLAPPPQPNYWQGNSLFVPTRGLLS